MSIIVTCIIVIGEMASGNINHEVHRYYVRCEENNSKRCDGKEIWLEATVLDELYEPTQLTYGSHVSISWKGKGGRINSGIGSSSSSSSRSGSSTAAAAAVVIVALAVVCMFCRH